MVSNSVTAVGYYKSPAGMIEVVSEDGVFLTCVRFIENLPDSLADTVSSPILERAMAWLDDFFKGIYDFNIPPLRPRGTDFQRMVWEELINISPSHTVTYGELSRRLGVGSAQAVGQAVKRNPIAIIIPCHRVVASNGMGGYAYGPERKKLLLDLEASMTIGHQGAGAHL